MVTVGRAHLNATYTFFRALVAKSTGRILYRVTLLIEIHKDRPTSLRAHTEKI